MFELVRDLDPAHIERWHGLLQDLFNGNVKVKLAGRIVHVQLASVANSGRQVFQTSSGIPIPRPGKTLLRRLLMLKTFLVPGLKTTTEKLNGRQLRAA